MDIIITTLGYIQKILLYVYLKSFKVRRFFSKFIDPYVIREIRIKTDYNNCGYSYVIKNMSGFHPCWVHKQRLQNSMYDHKNCKIMLLKDSPNDTEKEVLTEYNLKDGTINIFINDDNMVLTRYRDE